MYEGNSRHFDWSVKSHLVHYAAQRFLSGQNGYYLLRLSEWLAQIPVRLISMKAIVIKEDEARTPLWQDVADPSQKAGEVLVDVHYTALNRADLMQRAGAYPPPAGASEILGLEMSGVVRDAGESTFKKGDEVCALLTGGGYAEQVTVPAELLMPVPEAWTLEEAGGLPEVFFTSYLNLFMEAGLQKGERALVHGGASGIGTASIQLIKVAGADVYITAGTDEKVAFCKDLGADLAINYRDEDFAERIREHVGDKGVNVIMDMVGADYFERNIDLLTLNGRMVFISSLSGTKTELDIRKLMGKRIWLKGSTLRARPVEEKVRIRKAFMAQFWEALEARQIKPITDSVYPIEETASAHEHMRNNKNIGKILLKVR